MTVCIVYLFLFIYKSAIYIYRHTIIKYKSTIYNLLKKGVTCEFFFEANYIKWSTATEVDQTCKTKSSVQPKSGSTNSTKLPD